MRARRRVLGTLVAIGSLMATAVPASAATQTLKGSFRDVEVVTTTCSPTAAVGTACEVFIIRAGTSQPAGGAGITEISVEGGTTLVGAGWDIESNYESLTHGEVAVGTFSGTGTSLTVKFTVDLVCDVVACGASGPRSFSVKLTAPRATSYTEITTAQGVQKQEGCTITSTQTGANVRGAGGSGSVKGGGSTKKLRVWTNYGYKNRFVNAAQRAKLVKQEFCTDTTVVAEVLAAQLSAFVRPFV